jgi:hypothetical protein
MSVFGSGLIKANTEWRFVEETELNRVDSLGAVLYHRSLGSGTGYAQINQIWSEFGHITGIKTIDLFSLPVRLYDNFRTFSWSGGNIKSLQVAQSGSGNLNVSIGFPNYSGLFSIPTSGSLLISNLEGWQIGSSHRQIILTHGTTTAYQISLVGTL